MNRSVFDSNEGVEIVKRMIDATNEKHLHWESSRDTDQSFFAETPRFEVRVESRDRDDGHPYVLSLYSNAVSREVDQYETGVGSNAVLIDRIEKLYRAAKRQALGLTNVTEELMEDLESLRPRTYGPDEAPF